MSRSARVLPAIVLLALAGCSASSGSDPEPSVGPSTPALSETPRATPSVPAPGRLTSGLLPADILVVSAEPLRPGLIRRIRRVPGVLAVEPMTVAQLGIENRVITVAAVHPGGYRRFTPRASAYQTKVWRRVAAGEVAITPALGHQLQDRRGFLKLGNDAAAPRGHIGAFAAQIPRIDAVVNAAWIDPLELPEGNAVLVSTGLLTAPQAVRPAIERLVGAKTSVQLLGPDLDLTATQTAVLTGGSVAEAVGSFTYQVLAEGRIAPDPAWVAANIRTERVPILGEVTCHKVMLPQLRAALTEIAAVGLADEIHPEEYAGCYYPRFIANTTSLSLHSFGIAVDLNVPGNQRGTVGEIDRGVVAIFKKWGFAWGGDWRWTDPMHFEMNALVEVQ